MEAHQNEVHLKVKGVKCVLCGKKFSKKSNFETHQRNVHQKEKKYKCDQSDQCEASFAKKFELAAHIKLVHKPRIEKRLQCNICNESFEFNHQREKHEIKCQRKNEILQQIKTQ